MKVVFSLYNSQLLFPARAEFDGALTYHWVFRRTCSRGKSTTGEEECMLEGQSHSHTFSMLPVSLGTRLYKLSILCVFVCLFFCLFVSIFFYSSLPANFYLHGNCSRGPSHFAIYDATHAC